MFCRVCGGEIADDAVVCVKCGRATGVPLPPAPQPMVQTLAQEQAAAKPDEGGGALFVFGLIGAFIMPIIGLVFSIILLVKGKIGHGLGLGLVCVISWALWCSIAMGG